VTNHQSNQTDSALVEAVCRGDERAFEALYHRYRDWVVRAAWRFTGNDEDALDVLQETFAYVLRRLPYREGASAHPRFRLTAKFTTFLYPVVKHLSLSLVRKRKRQVSGDELFADLAATVDRATPHSELAEVVRVLPEAQREVLLLRFVDDMTLGEIAAALHVPLGTVKSRLHNALATLRQDPRTHAYFRE